MRNDPSNIVDYQSTPWNADNLSLIVQDYQLERESGIGISYIIAEFNKNEETVIGYVTFFDIETRELMFVVKAHGFYKEFGRDKKKAIRAAKKAE